MAVKENSADIMQREMLEREKELSSKSRFCDIFLTAIFCLFIIGFTVFHVVTPDRNYSDRENRVLHTLPEFSFESLFSGEYSSQITKEEHLFTLLVRQEMLKLLTIYLIHIHLHLLMMKE